MKKLIVSITCVVMFSSCFITNATTVNKRGVVIEDARVELYAPIGNYIYERGVTLKKENSIWCRF